MSNYEKPVILVNEELAEGVYAASGNCWSASAKSVQDWNGSHHVFEISLTHSTAVEHISKGATIELSFNSAITDAYSEFPASFSGNQVTVIRNSHANAYNSGDNATFKVWVKAADEATTKSLSAVGCRALSCDWTVNVQGGGANGQ